MKGATDLKQWLKEPQQMMLTSEERRSVRRFAATFGNQYGFLLTERSGKLIPDRTRPSKKLTSWPDALVETQDLIFRFQWDRGDVTAELSTRDGDFEWVDEQAACLLLLIGSKNILVGVEEMTIELPPPPEVSLAHNMSGVYSK